MGGRSLTSVNVTQVSCKRVWIDTKFEVLIGITSANFDQHCNVESFIQVKCKHIFFYRKIANNVLGHSKDWKKYALIKRKIHGQQIPTNRNAGKITRKQVRESRNLGEHFQTLLVGRAHFFGRKLQLWEVVEQTKFSKIWETWWHWLISKWVWGIFHC